MRTQIHLFLNFCSNSVPQSHPLLKPSTLLSRRPLHQHHSLVIHHHFLQISLINTSILFTLDSLLILSSCFCDLFCCSFDSDSSIASCPSSHHTAPLYGVSDRHDVMCIQLDSWSLQRRYGKSPGRLCRRSVCLCMLPCSLGLLPLKSVINNHVLLSSAVGADFGEE